jgi:uncharacterized lipoprotein YmbA
MRAHLAYACLVLVIAGCGSSPKERYYALAAPAPATGAAAAPAIAVGPVTVPEMVDQARIVVQAAGPEVTMYEYHRWASPLKREIERVLAANLAEALGTTRVWSYSQVRLPDPDYQVLVDVQRFDSALGDAVTIDALWTVRRPPGGAPRTGRSSVREPVAGAGFDALVAAHSRALARVSRDIAGAIRAP